MALVRFEPLLSSRSMADTVNRLDSSRSTMACDQLVVYGDQATASSVIFYTAPAGIAHQRAIELDDLGLVLSRCAPHLS